MAPPRLVKAPPSRRAPLAPLRREAIVEAAIAIADKEGLEAVSLRNVAAALDAGPMRLYGYVASKEELLELMVDEVYGEIVAEGAIRRPWRTALRTVAHRTRQAAHAHPWFVGLLSGRHAVGPNALTHLEASLAAVSGGTGFEGIDEALLAVKTLNAYVVGAIQAEAGEKRAEAESGMDEEAWQKAHWPTLERVLATGDFPTIARVVRDAKHPKPEAAFDQGLEVVLDGIAARRASLGRAG
jgi:AcrR family transcriptional regulator